MKSGDVFANKYRLVQRIGEGAMGEVWAGENLSTGRKVALKLIIRSAQKNANQDLCQRMLREARACGKLSHRHIVQILDVGETPVGDPFLVLELLRGRTLAERLKDTRRIEPSMAARIGADIANALAVAHAAKIIHRDLKPANIYLHQEEGDADDRFVVKVLDFGVSKEIDGHGDGPVTLTNVAVGSPVYMSPEQVALYRDLDGRTDIWSLGIVLYEMLTGGRPFSGGVNDVVRQIILTRIHKVPAASTKVRDISPEFDAVIARCLENDRALRYGDAGEVAKALMAIADAGVQMRTTGRVSRPAGLKLSTAEGDPKPAMGQLGAPPVRGRLPRLGTEPMMPKISHEAGPTGTQLISAQPTVPVSPAPMWRKEMAEWRAQRDAIAATRAGISEELHGGTQALDLAAQALASDERQPSATTSMLGALSPPELPTEGPIERPRTPRKRKARTLFILMGAGLASAVVLLVLLLWAVNVEHEAPRHEGTNRQSNGATSFSRSAMKRSAPVQPERMAEKPSAPRPSVATSAQQVQPAAAPEKSAPTPTKTETSIKPVQTKAFVPAKPTTVKPELMTCTKSAANRTCTKEKTKPLFGPGTYVPTQI